MTKIKKYVAVAMVGFFAVGAVAGASAHTAIELAQRNGNPFIAAKLITMSPANLSKLDIRI